MFFPFVINRLRLLSLDSSHLQSFLVLSGCGFSLSVRGGFSAACAEPFPLFKPLIVGLVWMNGKWGMRYHPSYTEHLEPNGSTFLAWTHLSWFSAVTTESEVKQEKLNVLIPNVRVAMITATSPLPFSISTCQLSSASKTNDCIRAKHWMEVVSHSLSIYTILLRALWALYLFLFLRANIGFAWLMGVTIICNVCPC